MDLIIDFHGDMAARVAYYSTHERANAHPGLSSVLLGVIATGGLAVLVDVMRFRNVFDLLGATAAAFMLYFFVAVIKPSLAATIATDEPELLHAAVDDLRQAHVMLVGLTLFGIVVLTIAYTSRQRQRAAKTDPAKHK